MHNECSSKLVSACGGFELIPARLHCHRLGVGSLQQVSGRIASLGEELAMEVDCGGRGNKIKKQRRNSPAESEPQYTWEVSSSESAFQSGDRSLHAVTDRIHVADSSISLRSHLSDERMFPYARAPHQDERFSSEV